MRARLLDMGEVSSIRSQSIYRAIVGSLGHDSEPVVVLARSAAAVVSISGTVAAGTVIDLDACRRERVTVVRRPGDGGVWVLDSGHLLLALLLPVAQSTGLGLGVSADSRAINLAEPLIQVCRKLGLEAESVPQGWVTVDTRRIARFEMTESPTAWTVIWDVAFAADPRLEARLLKGPSGVSTEEFAESIEAESTGFERELTETVTLAEIAEALVVAVEASLGLELVPSMPTPAEMDAIYEWDERLPVAELFDGAGPETSGPTAYLM